MIQPGTYTATVANHSIGETKKGDPQVIIGFNVSDKDGQHKITYYGYFTEKSTKYTIQNLITCGLKGNNPAGDLEIGKQVEVVIEHETGEDNKLRAKVRYINQVGGGRKAMPKDLALAKLSALEGAVIMARSESGQDNDEFGF